MDHYIDIRLRPDPEFPEPTLMGALYGKLHRTLVKLESDDIGVSFPEHALQPRTPGPVLRIHGTEQALARLMDEPWLTGMRDLVQMGDLARVPENARYRVVRRRQFKTNAERLRRRRARRHNESLEQARNTIPDDVEREVKLPFVKLRSQSTGQTFSLFIEHGEIRQEPVQSTFNQYGLSREATVPWF